jgi:hypothetical protein
VWGTTTEWIGTRAEKAVENIVAVTDTVDEFITTAINSPDSIAAGSRAQTSACQGAKGDTSRQRQGVSSEETGARATAEQLHGMQPAAAGQWEDFDIDDFDARTHVLL